MPHWRYRAIDASERVHNGVVRQVDEPHAALDLRQRGLQIIQLIEIDAEEYTQEARRQMREDRLRAKAMKLMDPSQGMPVGGYANVLGGPSPKVMMPGNGSISQERSLPIRQPSMVTTTSYVLMITLTLLLAYIYYSQSH